MSTFLKKFRKSRGEESASTSAKVPTTSAPTSSTSAFDQALIAWVSPEFLRYQRSWLWYFIFVLLDGALIAYAYLTHSITMIVVFALLPLVYLIEQKRHPRMVQVIISPYGIKFGELKVAFTDIKRFWILHDGTHLNELHLLTNRKLHPELTIPLLDLDPIPVRNVLVTQVPEWEGRKEDLIDTLIRIFKLA